MVVLATAFKANQKELFALSEPNHVWSYLSPLPWKVWTNLEEHRDLKLRVINAFIYAVSAMARNHNEEIQRALLNENDRYLEKLAHLLSEIEYGQETAEALLTLFVEWEISFTHLPNEMELKFCKALPYVHIASEHLDWHAKIFEFVKNMCQRSLSNILHVFETTMPSLCLLFVQKFPDLAQVSEREAQSIKVLLDLYQLISERVFRPVTFMVLLNMLKQTTGEQGAFRPWYTSVMLKSVRDILAKQYSSLCPFS